jgi:hypothetical protein
VRQGAKPKVDLYPVARVCVAPRLSAYDRMKTTVGLRRMVLWCLGRCSAVALQTHTHRDSATCIARFIVYEAKDMGVVMS